MGLEAKSENDKSDTPSKLDYEDDADFVIKSKKRLWVNPKKRVPSDTLSKLDYEDDADFVIKSRKRLWMNPKKRVSIRSVEEEEKKD